MNYKKSITEIYYNIQRNMQEIIEDNKENAHFRANKYDKQPMDNCRFDNKNNPSKGKYFGDSMNSKIYQQHLANRKIYDEIKSKNQYFGYEPLIRSKRQLCQSDMIRCYDKLLQQSTYLQKQLTKLQYNQTSQNDPFSFLINTWSKSKIDIEDSCLDRIDKMNKTVSAITSQIGHIMGQREEHLDYSTNMIIGSSEYQQLMKINLKANQQNMLLRQSSQKLEKEYQQKIQYLTDKSQKLQTNIENLSIKNKQLQMSQSDILSKINKLSQQILKKDKQIHQLKMMSGIVKRYSYEKEDDEKQSFQVIIKSNSNQIKNIQHSISIRLAEPIIISKTLEEITNYFESSNLEDYLQNIQILNQDISNISISDLSEKEDKNSEILEIIQQMERDHSLRLGYTSTKKQRHPKKRQNLFTNPKMAIQLNEDIISSKQLKFIRRK